MQEGYVLRKATSSDLDLLVRHRDSMLRDIGDDPEEAIGIASSVYRDWLRRKMASRRVVGFVVEDEHGTALASCCLWLQESPPSPHRLRLFTPYLMSVYTESPYRGRGLATRVVSEAIEWCKEHEYDQVRLHTSKFGRSIYERLGFEPTNEMRLKINRQSNLLGSPHIGSYES